MEENQETQQIEEKKKNPKVVFIVRLIVTFLVGIATPIIYVLARFKPFSMKETVSVGFAGVVAIAILGIAVCFLIKFYLEGVKTKYSLLKQILQGIYRVVIPTAGALAICYVFKTYISQLIEILLVLLPCEIVAIVVNPLPKWAFDNNVEGMGEIADKIFGKVKINVKKEEE